LISFPNCDVAFYHDMRLHDRFLTDHCRWLNNRKRSDLDISAKSQEGDYSEANKSLILRGDAENKVYLKYGDDVYNRDEYVEIQRLGTKNVVVKTKRRG